MLGDDEHPIRDVAASRPRRISHPPAMIPTTVVVEAAPGHVRIEFEGYTGSFAVGLTDDEAEALVRGIEIARSSRSGQETAE
jgi:hypothetical protein